MIYVHRDLTLIPQKILNDALRAQEELEKLTQDDRKKFIKKKSHIWRAFGRYLSQMSYGKCWYSESPDPHSFFDVDHFRPKLEAKRSEDKSDIPGYEWLAFSWDNFRYATNCSNRLKKNIETGEVEGKGSWFPLMDGSQRASWDNRCEAAEKPLLLDPVIKTDVALIDVGANGRMEPSPFAVGSARKRVDDSCKFYGLNQPEIIGARKRLIREIVNLIEVLHKTLQAAQDSTMTDTLADKLPVREQMEILREKTYSRSPYAKTARATLILQGFPQLCAAPEEQLKFQNENEMF